MGIAPMTNGGFKLLVVLTFPLLVEALGAFDFLDLSGGERSTLVFWHRFVPKRKGGRSIRSLCTGIAFADCQNCATRQGLRPDTR